MSEKLKIALIVVATVVGVIALFALIVCIGCSVNGLKFGPQISDWFGGNSAAIEAGAEAVKDIANTPLA